MSQNADEACPKSCAMWWEVISTKLSSVVPRNAPRKGGTSHVISIRITNGSVLGVNTKVQGRQKQFAWFQRFFVLIIVTCRRSIRERLGLMSVHGEDGQ